MQRVGIALGIGSSATRVVRARTHAGAQQIPAWRVSGS